MDNSSRQPWIKVDCRIDRLNPGEGAAQPSPTGSEESPFSLIEGVEELDEPINPTTTGPARDQPGKGGVSLKADMSSDDAKGGDKPQTPKMGGVRETSKGSFTAWCGGVPKHDWTRLVVPDAEDKRVLVTPSMYRPTSISANQKSYVYRCSGLTEKFDKTSDRQTFVTDVMTRFKDTGLDTITYLRDPVEDSKMISVVTVNARLALELVTKLIEPQVKLYDSYDLENDRAAVKFLLASLEPTLRKKVQERFTSEDEPFPVV